jgi:hypothetical protein
MKPCLKNRCVVEVLAGISWEATLKHRVYSCPDLPKYDFALGATALILKNKRNGFRIPLEVCSVVLLQATELESLIGIEQQYREQVEKYIAGVNGNVKIIRPGCAHRFYILGSEPWPSQMQKLTASASATEWAAILSICADPDQFFQWPQASSLLWPGCVRTQNDGEYDFPPEIVTRLAGLGIKPDTRTNGPAINAFLVAGGNRPKLGNEGWPVHHVFDGTNGAPHAIRGGDLFTHSAGLVAAHPVAHHMAHQSVLLKWLLRREAFLRFGFDPEGDFVIP